ncbi:phosphatidylinositol N-acetylglucosaminyltransferase subunit Q [Lampetra fluviatilis]
MITKVYFPGCCLLAESGLLLGCRDPASGSVLVLAVLHFPFVPARVRAYLEGLRVSSGKDLRVLGSWVNGALGAAATTAAAAATAGAATRDRSEATARAKEDGNFLKDLREVFGRDVWVHIFKQTSEQLPRSCQVFRKAGPVTMGAFARLERDTHPYPPAEGAWTEDGDSCSVIFIRYDQRKVSLAKWLAEGSEVEDPEERSCANPDPEQTSNASLGSWDAERVEVVGQSKYSDKVNSRNLTAEGLHLRRPDPKSPGARKDATEDLQAGEHDPHLRPTPSAEPTLEDDDDDGSSGASEDATASEVVAKSAGRRDAVGQPVSELAFVFGAASACHELYELDEYNEGPVRTSHWQSGGREGSVVVELVKHVSGPVCAVLTYLLAGVASVFGSRMFWFWPLSWLWEKLSMSLQVRHRLAHLREVFSTERADTHVSFMRKANVLCSLLIDTALGLFIVSLLYREDRISLIADALLPLAENVASELRSLLQWLMGVPAGLKLNNALDQTLGRFFLYHIHLWLSYLSVLAPLVRPVLWHAGLSACLGASILLSVASDILSLLTFHIYCFYVYAARLYKLMVYGLTSLWRLFRGKKWNVLRRRVDSCSYDVDQLFLGTLLFTILLFLLPTVALYYLVFSLLRLAVVLAQGALHQLVELINSVPTFALGLRICRGYRLADGITMEVLEQNSSRILHLDMQIQPVSLMSVLRRYRLPTYSSSAQHSWLSLLGKLCAGDLIYPWRHKDEKVE